MTPDEVWERLNQLHNEYLNAATQAQTEANKVVGGRTEAGYALFSKHMARAQAMLDASGLLLQVMAEVR